MATAPVLVHHYAILMVCALTALLSVVGTRVMIAWARRRNLIDLPNHRSSHSQPTPRGGGVALVAAFYVGLLGSWQLGIVTTHTLLVLLCGLPIAVISYIDDLYTLGARIRLAIQLLCAGTFLALLPSLPPLVILGYTLPVGSAFAIYLFGMVWMTNLYNFMDGIDGIAASQAIAAGILWAAVLPDSAMMPPLLLAAAALGFLKYNFPPARIFMGDVGSAFCGFIIAAMALVQSRETVLLAPFWLIPMAPFIADATVTLFTRMLRGQRVSEAHRTHAYQRLARRLDGHLSVSLGYFLLTSLLVGPFFLWVALRAGQYAELVFVVAVAVLMAVAIGLGAGQDDKPSQKAIAPSRK